MDDKKLSERISDFNNLLRSVKSSYEYMNEKMTEQDKHTQDILHKLELEDIKYNERARLATELQKVRRERRMYKDGIEELKPIVDFADKKLIDSVGQLLGEVRRVEKYHQNRQYFPKIINNPSERSKQK